MGLPDDYFSEMRNFAALANKSTFLDLNETWQRATWSRDDVHIAAAIGATHTIAKLVQDEGGFFNNTNTNIYYWKLRMMITSVFSRWVSLALRDFGLE